ncbi:MAG: putative metal-binding motif-containing protein [Nanoarchaeota archaeon]
MPKYPVCIIWLLCVLIGSMVCYAAEAPPSIPPEYWGSAIYNGQPAKDGLMVRAFAENGEYGQNSYTLNGYYSIILMNGDKQLTYLGDPSCENHWPDQACVQCSTNIGSDNYCIEGPQTGDNVLIRINGSKVSPILTWQIGNVNQNVEFSSNFAPYIEAKWELPDDNETFEYCEGISEACKDYNSMQNCEDNNCEWVTTQIIGLKNATICASVCDTDGTDDILIVNAFTLNPLHNESLQCITDCQNDYLGNPDMVDVCIRLQCSLKNEEMVNKTSNGDCWDTVNEYDSLFDAKYNNGECLLYSGKVEFLEGDSKGEYAVLLKATDYGNLYSTFDNLFLLDICESDSDCSDGLACNGIESCVYGICQSGIVVDCSESDVTGVSSCTNDPDNNPLTWDYRGSFTSYCVEPGTCAQGDDTVLSVCNISCGAGCVLDNDCDDSDSGTTDQCDECICTNILTCVDLDNDGYNVTGGSCGPVDCNDTEPTINPGMADSNCNGIDENCDGTPDNAYVVTDTSCGLGVCASTGQLTCNSGQETDSCAAGNPTGSDDNCNILDENCDGTADNAYVVTDTSCGTGVCVSTGQLTCNSGQETDSCAAGNPTGSDDNCNGIDENCDGTVDNAYVITDTSCGIGVCASTGQLTCSDGVETDSCSAGSPTGLDDNCNGLDENCDGTADNAYVVTDTSCGIGVCASTGQLTCNSGVESDSCSAGSPTGLDNNCNSIDENCDGTVDNAYVVTDTSCGIGVCASTGQLTCSDGVETDSCSAGSPTGLDDNCNGLDENCDGTNDNGGNAYCDDGLECTDDICNLGFCEHTNLPQNTKCGYVRDCQDSGCRLDVFYYTYPVDGQDYCDGFGSCLEYYCSSIDISCDTQCGAECGNSDDCDDYDAYTSNICEADCSCNHLEQPDFEITGFVQLFPQGKIMAGDLITFSLIMENKGYDANDVIKWSFDPGTGQITESNIDPININSYPYFTSKQIMFENPGTYNLIATIDNANDIIEAFEDNNQKSLIVDVIGECEIDTDCEVTDCTNLDGCYKGTYRDYDEINIPNTCNNYECTNNKCISYTEVTTDLDGDGYDTQCDNDCDDADSDVHPGGLELCNGVDDDCNGEADGYVCNPAFFEKELDPSSVFFYYSISECCTGPANYEIGSGNYRVFYNPKIIYENIKLDYYVMYSDWGAWCKLYGTDEYGAGGRNNSIYNGWYVEGKYGSSPGESHLYLRQGEHNAMRSVHCYNIG